MAKKTCNQRDRQKTKWAVENLEGFTPLGASFPADAARAASRRLLAETYEAKPYLEIDVTTPKGVVIPLSRTKKFGSGKFATIKEAR